MHHCTNGSSAGSLTQDPASECILGCPGWRRTKECQQRYKAATGSFQPKWSQSKTIFGRVQGSRCERVTGSRRIHYSWVVSRGTIRRRKGQLQRQRIRRWDEEIRMERSGSLSRCISDASNHGLCWWLSGKRIPRDSRKEDARSDGWPAGHSAERESPSGGR